VLNLNDRGERDAHPVQISDQLRHRRLAPAGFDHGAVLNGLGEQHGLGAHLGQNGLWGSRTRHTSLSRSNRRPGASGMIGPVSLRSPYLIFQKY
jgi:hypothetical protein